MHYDSKELNEGEIFICNTIGEIPEKWRSLKTVRLGNQAYDIHGNKLHPDHYRPLFVHKSEYDELNRLWQNEVYKANRE